jgi:hypothetical protein
MQVSKKGASVRPFPFYCGCQKDVPITERLFVTTPMPPSFFRNLIMTSGRNGNPSPFFRQKIGKYVNIFTLWCE